MKKQMLITALAMSFLLLLATVPASAESGITVILDGKTMSFDVPPQLMNGRTMVPLRAVFEAMGAHVDWDGETETVTGTKGDTVVVLTIGDTSPTINEQVVTIDQPGVIVDGRTLAPLRFVGEAFGGIVGWDGDSQTVTITSGAGTATPQLLTTQPEATPAPETASTPSPAPETAPTPSPAPSSAPEPTPKPPATTGGGYDPNNPWAGSWQGTTSYFGVFTMIQNGNKVTGEFDKGGGDTGNFYGDISNGYLIATVIYDDTPGEEYYYRFELINNNYDLRIERNSGKKGSPYDWNIAIYAPRVITQRITTLPSGNSPLAGMWRDEVVSLKGAVCIFNADGTYYHIEITNDGYYNFGALLYTTTISIYTGKYGFDGNFMDSYDRTHYRYSDRTVPASQISQCAQDVGKIIKIMNEGSKSEVMELIDPDNDLYKTFRVSINEDDNSFIPREVSFPDAAQLVLVNPKPGAKQAYTKAE